MEGITFNEGEFKKEVQVGPIKGRKPCILAINGGEVKCSCEGTVSQFLLTEVDYVEVKAGSITFFMKDYKRFTLFQKGSEVAKRFSEYMEQSGVNLRVESSDEAVPKPAKELLPPLEIDSVAEPETTSDESSDKSSLIESSSDDCFVTTYYSPSNPDDLDKPVFRVVKEPKDFDV